MLVVSDFGFLATKNQQLTTILLNQVFDRLLLCLKNPDISFENNIVAFENHALRFA